MGRRKYSITASKLTCNVLSVTTHNSGHASFHLLDYIIPRITLPCIWRPVWPCSLISHFLCYWIIDNCNHWLEFSKRSTTLRLLNHSLERARPRMVQQANSKRQDKEFLEGDWVYLKLQPYLQVPVHHHCKSSQKVLRPNPIIQTHRIFSIWTRFTGVLPNPSCISRFLAEILLGKTRYSTRSVSNVDLEDKIRANIYHNPTKLNHFLDIVSLLVKMSNRKSTINDPTKNLTNRKSYNNKIN